MIYQIQFEAHPAQDDLKILEKGISDYAVRKKNQPPMDAFAFFVRDEHGQIKGGCNGYIYYGCLDIDQLWLDETIRGQGLGTQLMQKAETYAKKNKCLFATLNTMDWEALDFYKKLGYHVEYQRTGYLHHSVFYFLRKELVRLSYDE